MVGLAQVGLPADGLARKLFRLGVVRCRDAVSVEACLQQRVVGFGIDARRLNPLLSLTQPYPQLPHDGVRDFGLQRQHITLVALERVGPELHLCGSVDELHIDAYPVALPQNGPLYDAVNVQFPRGLAH